MPTDKNLAMAVIEDVLARLQQHVLEPEAGEYIQPSVRLQLIRHEPLAELVRSDRTEPCAACAVGTLFLGLLLEEQKATDDYTCSLHLNSDYMRRRLEAAFTMRTLELVEYAFEGWHAVRGLESALTSADTDHTRRFYESADTDHRRMVRILENMKANGGDFIPEGLSG